jgi:hypothetical protein
MAATAAAPLLPRIRHRLIGNRIFLYYFGISLRRDVPYQSAIGLAISDDGGASFRRAALDRSSRSVPSILFYVLAARLSRCRRVPDAT